MLVCSTSLVLFLPCFIPQKWWAVDSEGKRGRWSKLCVFWVIETEVMSVSVLEARSSRSGFQLVGFDECRQPSSWSVLIRHLLKVSWFLHCKGYFTYAAIWMYRKSSSDISTSVLPLVFMSVNQVAWLGLGFIFCSNAPCTASFMGLLGQCCLITLPGKEICGLREWFSECDSW